MNSVRDFYAFEWISIAVRCWRWGETSMGLLLCCGAMWRKWPFLFQGYKHWFHTIWANVMVVPILFCSADSPVSLLNQMGCLAA